MILRHTFTPHNNTRLAHLCGPSDQHLRTIENGLQVKIAHRHEQFKIDGVKAKAHQALDVLQALYEMAADPIIEDAVQLLLAGDKDMLQADPDAPSLHTRRGSLRARRPDQAIYLDNIAQHDIT